MKWLWLAAAVVMIAAAGSVWYAFQRPDFVAGLTAVAVAAAWKALKPDLKKHWASKTPEEWRELREQRDRERRGDR